jgi:SAM-dependent methyltransferase
VSGWDSFWEESSAEASYIGQAGTHALFVEYWSGYFETLGHLSGASRCLDIASGTGIVIQCARNHFADQPPSLTGLDMSPAAIGQLTSRYPGVNGVVADAAAAPFASGSFDLVTSQFGAEYAGDRGILEAARLVAEHGHLALLLHCRPGVIYDECAASLRVVDQVQSARLFPVATTMFKAGFAATRGADRRPYDRAARKFRQALRVLERAITKYGSGVASGFIARLYNDLQQMSQRLQHYDPAEVLGWLDQMGGELLSYRVRMKTMTDAALSRSRLDRVAAAIAAEGLTITDAVALGRPEDSAPIAWSLQAHRGSGN